MRRESAGLKAFEKELPHLTERAASLEAALKAQRLKLAVESEALAAKHKRGKTEMMEAASAAIKQARAEAIMLAESRLNHSTRSMLSRNERLEAELLLQNSSSDQVRRRAETAEHVSAQLQVRIVDAQGAFEAVANQVGVMGRRVARLEKRLLELRGAETSQRSAEGVGSLMLDEETSRDGGGSREQGARCAIIERLRHQARLLAEEDAAEAAAEEEEDMSSSSQALGTSLASEHDIERSQGPWVAAVFDAIVAWDRWRAMNPSPPSAPSPSAVIERRVEGRPFDTTHLHPRPLPGRWGAVAFLRGSGRSRGQKRTR